METPKIKWHYHHPYMGVDVDGGKQWDGSALLVFVMDRFPIYGPPVDEAATKLDGCNFDEGNRRYHPPPT